jgi:hypothetical protein
MKITDLLFSVRFHVRSRPDCIISLIFPFYFILLSKNIFRPAATWIESHYDQQWVETRNLVRCHTNTRDKGLEYKYNILFI